MAKMFYSLEEAAEKLGKSSDELKQLAESGELHQYRDRDRVMFKVDEVDRLAGGGDAGGGDEDEEDAIALSDTDTGAGGDASESGGTDAIDLASVSDEQEGSGGASGSSSDEGQGKSDKDKKGQSGVSVFEADEVDTADPMAQTVVSESAQSSGEDEDEVALESVGSGSGLLDLTRESDDTSLGAELLEEIYPAGGSDAKMEGSGEQTGNFEGMFDAAGGADSAGSSIGEPAESGEPVAAAPTVVAAEAPDAVASGWTGGMLIGAIASLIIALISVVGAMSGITPGLTAMIAGNLLVWLGALGGGTLVLAIVGYLLGKAVG